MEQKEKSKAEQLIALAEANEIEHPTQSKGITLLSAALVQVEMTLRKAEEAMTQLQQNLGKINEQRLGLSAQKMMLVELKAQLEEIERIETNTKLVQQKPAED